MNPISESSQIGDILDKFYQEYNLGEDGGNHLDYVRLEFGNLFNFYIPNWDARRKAVLRHDIHHLVTGYKSEILGEFEIAAWEIASGCTRYWAAYLLNSLGLFAGLLVHTKATFKAFIRGCRSQNLYNLEISDYELKVSTIGQLRDKLIMNNVSLLKPKWNDVLKLVLHIFIGIFIQILSLLLIPIVLIYTVWVNLETN